MDYLLFSQKTNWQPSLDPNPAEGATTTQQTDWKKDFIAAVEAPVAEFLGDKKKAKQLVQAWGRENKENWYTMSLAAFGQTNVGLKQVTFSLLFLIHTLLRFGVIVSCFFYSSFWPFMR